MSKDLRRKNNGPVKKTLLDLPPDWYDILMDMGKEGKSPAEVMAELGIGKSVWARFTDEEKGYPDFIEAVEIYHALAEACWMEQGQGMAFGDRPGSPQMWIFIAKNRFGMTDKSAVDHTSNGETVKSFSDLYKK